MAFNYFITACFVVNGTCSITLITVSLESQHNGYKKNKKLYYYLLGRQRVNGASYQHQSREEQLVFGPRHAGECEQDK